MRAVYNSGVTFLGTMHSQIVYDPLGHKTNMLWENITHITGIANPHTRHQRIANPLGRGDKARAARPVFGQAGEA